MSRVAIVLDMAGAEVMRDVPWPFFGGDCPAHLGAVIQTTVLSGELPALLVIHDSDNDWLVGDGVNDPNEPGAAVVSHITHAIERNSSIVTLADLPPGWQARRDGPGAEWVRSPHEYVE